MNDQQPIWTKNFISVCIVQLTMFSVFYSLLTTLPVYMVNHLRGTEVQGGLVAVTAILMASILIRPFSGKIIEAIGKKRVLVISVISFTAISFLYIWVHEYIPLLILRFFHGLSFGIASTATGAIAADIVPLKRRGEGVGYYAMSMNLAMVTGPFIGLTLLQYVSYQMLFIILSLMMLIGILLAFLIQVPVHHDACHIQMASNKRKFSVHDLFEVKAIPIGSITLLMTFAYSGVISFLSVYANSLGLITVSSYFFVVFAIVMIAPRRYFGKLYDRKGPAIVILPCLFIFAIGLIFLGFTRSSWMLLLSAAILGLGFGSLLPSFQTLSVQNAPNHRTGHATATYFAFYETGQAVGSFVLGVFAAQFGYQKMYFLSALVVFVVMGLFSLNRKKDRQLRQTLEG
jgi:MFS family permease